jgi:hypothetical protein
MTASPIPAPVVHTQPADLSQLRRLRWAVRATLLLGVAASVAANVLHARPNAISQVIAAWPPLALLLTVELISRVPSNRRALAVLRMLAAAAIAGIAAWVSYWHMVGVAAHYGETEAGASYLLPVSVDGLVLVASVSLVEIAGRIRCATALQPPTGTRFPQPSPAPTSPGPSPNQVTASTENWYDGQPEAHPVDDARTFGRDKGDGEQPHRHNGHESTKEPQTIERPDPQQTASQPDQQPPTQNDIGSQPADDDQAVPTHTAAAVAYWYRRDPGLHPADIASRIGRSERTVRRYWPPTDQPCLSGTPARRPADSLRR